VFYGEQTKDPIAAYAIELQEPRFDGRIIGSLYELNYPLHFKRVQKYALPRSPITQIHTPPLDKEKWQEVLNEAQAERYGENYKIYDKDNYLTAFKTKRHTSKIAESDAEM
jgi:hypothetical protein